MSIIPLDKLVRDIISHTEVQAIRSDFSVKANFNYSFKERNNI
jgi:hypothetical protein